MRGKESHARYMESLRNLYAGSYGIKGRGLGSGRVSEENRAMDEKTALLGVSRRDCESEKDRPEPK